MNEVQVSRLFWIWGIFLHAWKNFLLQFEYIKEVIDTADYYILILGGNTGSLYDEKNGISYTRKEYEYAIEKKIPIIAFVKADDSDEPLIDKTDLAKARAYEIFLNDVQDARLRRTFKTSEELKGLVFQSLIEEFKVHPRNGWKRVFKTNAVFEELLLRGYLLYYIVIDKGIYSQDNKIDHVEVNNVDLDIFSGPGSQGVFNLSCLYNGNNGYNFYDAISSNAISCLDEDGYLKEGYSIQLSLPTLGNTEDTLLFFSVGDGETEMMTKIYKIDNYALVPIGNISGQAFMHVDYCLTVPIGGQGIYETYVYCEGEIMRAEPLCDVDE